MKRLFFCLLLAASVAPASAVILAREGAPALPIVFAADATPAEQFAVEELALHLGKITGGAFAAVTEAELPADTQAIFVGHTRFAAAADIEAAALGGEEWLLRTVGGNLVLTGGRPRGTLYAVYEFLERELGVAWLSEDVSLLPERPNLVSGPLDRTGKPAFGTVRWVYTDVRRLNHVPEFIEKMEIFHSRNKVGDGAWLFSKPRYGARQRGTAATSHSFYAIIPPDTYFDDHPEWFSMNVNGDRMRGGGQLCLTNTEMTAEVIRRLREFIAQDRERAAETGFPPPVRYELSMNDHHMMCRCRDCRAVAEREGAESGLVLEFVNQVAEDIARDYPEIELRTFAYSLTFRPPKTVRPRDNVVMMLAYLADSEVGHNWICPAKSLAHPYHETHKTVTESWREIGARIQIWDYWRTFAGDAFETPYTKVSSLAHDFQYLHRLGVADGYFVEYYGAYTLSFFSLARWLGLKLMDDPYQDAEALIRRFMEVWYGPASSEMRQWLDYLEQRLAAFAPGLPATPIYRRTYLDIPFFTTAYEILARAEAKCAPESEELIRVRRERLPVDTALLGLWDTLERRLAEGEPMPWDRGAILDRYAEHKKIVMASVHIPRTLPGALEKFAEEIDRLRLEMDQPPLPAAFQQLPAEDVVDILRQARWEAPHHHRRVVEDAAAPGGIAIRLEIDKFGEPGTNIPLGVWSPGHFGPSVLLTPPATGEEAEWFEQGMGGARRAPRMDIPQDETYHWYKLGPFTIRPGSLMHAHRTWYLSVPGLDRPLSLGYPEEDWFVFVAFKVEGPAYVKNSTKPNAFSVGRIILVRAANPAAKDFQP